MQRRTQLLDRQAAALEKLVLLMQQRTAACASSPSELPRAQAAVGVTRLERERAREAIAVGGPHRAAETIAVLLRSAFSSAERRSLHAV